MNCPMCVNIGVYSVKANERTKEYFDLCIQLARESPGTHDQWIMGQLLELTKEVRAGRPPIEFKGRWDPPPEATPKLKHPVFHGLYNTHEIVASERPIPVRCVGCCCVWSVWSVLF